MKVKSRTINNIRPCNLLIVIITFLLCSCGTKNWDITPDKFAYKNLTELRIDQNGLQSGLTVISDTKLLKYLLSEIDTSLAEDKITNISESGNSWFYSWQSIKSRKLKEFTIIVQINPHEPEMYYLILNDKGKVTGSKMVASFIDFGKGMYILKTIFRDSSNLEIVSGQFSTYDLYSNETVTKCNITETGTFNCSVTIKLIPAVCLLDKLTIKATPEVKGEYVTSVMQGEDFYELGETIIDKASPDKVAYTKVQKRDGTVGWVQKKYIASPAVSGAVLKDAYIYKEARGNTKTNDKFERLSIIGVLEVDWDREWAKVKGNTSNTSQIKEGWVKWNTINTSDVDVRTAMLIKKTMLEEDQEKRKNMFEEMVNDPDLQSSNFMDDLKVLAGLQDDKNSTTLKLTWKNVDISQYGNSYSFENEEGEEITYNYSDIPEFSSEKNPYFTRYESEESMFGVYKINENVIGKWYWVTTESRQIEQDLSGEIIDADVIINIRPIE